jgi:hypothetical protein
MVVVSPLSAASSVLGRTEYAQSTPLCTICHVRSFTVNVMDRESSRVCRPTSIVMVRVPSPAVGEIVAHDASLDAVQSHAEPALMVNVRRPPPAAMVDGKPEALSVEQSVAAGVEEAVDVC